MRSNMDMELNEERKSKFNEGWFKVARISKLKENCHDARLVRDYGRWFTCLQGIRSEINSKLSKPKNGGNEKSEREIADEYDQAANYWIEEKKDKIVNVGNFSGKVSDLDIYNVLYAYELWLEDMKDRYKIGMPDMDEDDGL